MKMLFDRNVKKVEKTSRFSRNVLIFAIFAVFFAIFAISLPNFVAFADETNNKYVVTANSAVVFESADLTSAKLATLSNKTEITLVMDGQKPQEFVGEGCVFFKTQSTFETASGNVSGYILSDLVTPKTNVIAALPNFNAKTNAQCRVFFMENNEMKQSEIILEKGAQIFLYEGFKNKNPYTAISFVHENQILYGYLETKNINPNGINPLVITCACIILALLGIIFAFLFMKNKNTKKPKTKKEKTISKK